MLSVILYGRNDSHGYNLHKRGAISLNAIAEVLTDPDDELIFVDYNTPDELPTFPEAIADTLTEQCKARLRIIRVRPEFHRRYAGQTRLVALECQSRNIAIRRANPANSWILSTNTDMIFCPTAPFGSLGEVVASLEPGFYHLPRFEVPEGFWERLDRQDPEAAIAAMRDNGVRFHINEIVYGFYDNVYEGPGDFQLFRRDDLEAISGFDERMILGWHADANMARRMRILRGEVKTAFDKVRGYHCGHTRQATSLHRGGVRVENDQAQFVGNVESPFAPWQADTWGAPDVDFEEIRLDVADRYFEGMARAVPGAGPQYSEARLSVETFGKVGYAPDHVLPHLCDLLFNLPPGQRLFFFGDDLELLTGLRAFLEEAGRRPRFIIAREGAVASRLPTGEGWEVLAFADAVQQADVLVVQNPSYAEPPDCHGEWMAARALGAIASTEGRRPPSERRRVVVVNAIQNALGSPVEAVLAPTSMPFSSRLRQGFVIDPTPETEFSPAERDVLRRAAVGLVNGEPMPGWQRVALELLEVAAWRDFGLTDEAAARVADAARAVLDDVRSQALGELVERGASLALTRLCSGEDWQNPDLIPIARTALGRSPSRFTGRQLWVWERLAIAHVLSERLPTDDLKSFGSPELPRLLMITTEPDLMAPIACSMGYEVRYVTAGEFLSGQKGSQDWSDIFATPWLNVPPLHSHLFDAPSEEGRFDAVVFVSSWTSSGREAMDPLLRAARPMLKPDALMVATVGVQLSAHEPVDALSFGEWAHLFEADGPLGARNFTPVGPADLRVPLDAAVRFASSPYVDDGLPVLSHGQNGSVATLGVICAHWPQVLGEGRLERPVVIPPWMRPLTQRLGRRLPLFASDQDLTRRAIRGLLEGEPRAGWERLAPEVGAAAASDAEIRRRFGVADEDAPVLLAQADKAMRDLIAPSAAVPEPPAPGPLAGTRMCSGRDWEDPRWAGMASSLFSPTVAELRERSRWIWERTTLMDALEATAAARVLLVSPAPDALGHLLAHRGHAVVCVSAEELLGGEDQSQAWKEMLASAWLPARAEARPWADRGAGHFDAVLVTTHGLAEYGPERLDALLDAIHPHLSEVARLHATFNVSLDAREWQQAVSLHRWRGLFEDNGLLDGRGLRALSGVDVATPLDTVVRRAVQDAAEDTIPGLSFTYGDSLTTVALASARWPAVLAPRPALASDDPLPAYDPQAVAIPYIDAPGDDAR